MRGDAAATGAAGLRALLRGPGGAKRALKCYVSTPSAVEALERRLVLAAAAGRYWSIFVVADRSAEADGDLHSDMRPVGTGDDGGCDVGAQRGAPRTGKPGRPCASTEYPSHGSS